VDQQAHRGDTRTVIPQPTGLTSVDRFRRRAAGRLWSEGRSNPVSWQIRTALGTFSTDDRSTWHTDGGQWTAELRRSTHGQHWYLALFDGGVYRGRYDDRGWHEATARSRVRQLRSYQLRLVA
jgi:hypothetical protein